MRLRGILCVVLSFPVGSVSFAEWRDHTELPAWCSRGTVRWAHGFCRADAELVTLALRLDQNLWQSASFADDAARDLAIRNGLRMQPYICSKTIRWRRLFPNLPELDKCTCLRPDGTRALMYGNPERYAGCYNSPIWKRYIKSRIKQTLGDPRRPAASIFFDNVNFYDCHCAICRAKFKDYARKKFGVEMALSRPREFPNFGLAKTLFQADSTFEFFEEMKAYIRTIDKEVVISPNFHVSNGWTTYLTQRGTADLVFYEEGRTFPPFGRTAVGYKIALAVSRGRVVGQLLGLPRIVAESRAFGFSPRHEAGIVESFVYPEEHMLATAEAAACNGTYIPSFAIREQRLRARNTPYYTQVNDALHRYYKFTRDNRRLYALAQPGSRIAVLHSIWSRLAHRRPYWGIFQQTCRALIEAGVPFEVITAEDLKPELLKPYKAAIIPHAVNLLPDEAAAITAYARAGNGIVVIGDVAREDRLGRPYPTASRPALAKLAAGTMGPLGKGRFWRLERPIESISVPMLIRGIEVVANGISCRVAPASKTLFANVLRSADGKATSIHHGNSACQYEIPDTGELANDRGAATARIPFTQTRYRARTILDVKGPRLLEKPVVRFFGNTWGGRTFQLVVSVNGKDIKAFPGQELRDLSWREAPIPAGLLRAGANEVVIRVTGRPNSHPDYFNLQIDTTAPTRGSAASSDSGKTYSSDDLSPFDKGKQAGEYMIRIADKTKLRTTWTPADFMGKLTVRPATDVAVIIEAKGDAPAATLLSPDGETQRIQPETRDHPAGLSRQAIYRVPSVRIYSVLVLE